MPKIHTRTEHYYLLSEIAAEVAAKTGESYSSILLYIKEEFDACNGYWPEYHDLFEVECAFEGNVYIEADSEACEEINSLLQKCSVILMDD